MIFMLRDDLPITTRILLWLNYKPNDNGRATFQEVMDYIQVNVGSRSKYQISHALATLEDYKVIIRDRVTTISDLGKKVRTQINIITDFGKKAARNILHNISLILSEFQEYDSELVINKNASKRKSSKSQSIGKLIENIMNSLEPNYEDELSILIESQLCTSEQVTQIKSNILDRTKENLESQLKDFSKVSS